MSESDLPAQLPARAGSAFAGSSHVEVGRDGRKLGGCTTPEYHAEFWTEERREEQRQRAKAAIAAGTFGAANGFHRRKTKRFQEIAAEHAQERADQLVRKLDDIIHHSKSPEAVLRAIEMYAKFEDWAVKNSREDEKEFRKLTGDQLNARLLETIGEAMGIDFGAYLEAQAEVTDADVVEDGDEPYVAGITCERCDADAREMTALLRERGVESEDLLARTRALARCVEHRVAAAVDVAEEDFDGADE